MTNYNKLKDVELIEYMDKYELDKGDYLNDNGSVNRVKISKILKLIDVQAGKIPEQGVVITEDEEVKDYDPKVKMHKNLSGMMVQVTFYHSDENDMPYVQMALNGIALIVRRETKSWIPKEFVDGVLQFAIATKMKLHVTNTGDISYIPKQIPRFAHTVHDIKHIEVLAKEYDDKKKKERR